jgi:hypothetical protein
MCHFFFLFLIPLNAKHTGNLFFFLVYEILKWGTMRYTLSSPCISMIENGRSSRRNVGSCIITGALRAIIIRGIDWESLHQTIESMCPANLLRGRGLIWFWPTKEGIPIVLQFYRKCKVWVTPLHPSQLTKRKEHFTRTNNGYCIK